MLKNVLKTNLVNSLQALYTLMLLIFLFSHCLQIWWLDVICIHVEIFMKCTYTLLTMILQFLHLILVYLQWVQELMGNRIYEVLRYASLFVFYVTVFYFFIYLLLFF